MALMSGDCRALDVEGLSGLGDECYIDESGNTVCGPVSSTPSSAGGGFWDTLSNLVGSWSKTGQQILLQQNLPTGVYTQTGPGGTVTYVQPKGSTTTLPVGTGTFQANATPGFGLVIVGGAALLILMMLMRRK